MNRDEQITNLLRAGGARRISRRDLLRYTGAGVSSAALAAFLAACGIEGQGGDNASNEQAVGIWENAEQTGELNFANWPLYIDKERQEGEVVRPSLELFTEQTGIQVNYDEVIQGNDTFFARIEPSLSAGDDTGYDIIVITNGIYLDKLITLGYLTPLDHSQLPNFAANAGGPYKDPSYDPGNQFTIPWQSGLTGIGYDPNLTGREITSYRDLLDPAFQGQVGMFGDTLDLPNLAMVGLGINPETSEPDQWREAADLLTQQRDAGIVRQYYEQNYIQALQAGDVALTMAWSGDIFQAQNSGSPQLEFVVPDEGAVIWTDNMCIPSEPAHPVDAIKMMDFVYRPEVAAMITEWVTYITPVPTCHEIVAQHADEAEGGDARYLQFVANSPLVFPTPGMYESVYRYRVLTPEEEEEWNSIFQPVYQA